MKAFPASFAQTTQALPRELLSEVDQAALGQLADKGYEVHTGLTPEYAEAITQMALEPSIREYCPRDCAERFVSRTTTEQWLAKGRVTFLLLKKTDQGLSLAGYGWSGRGTNEHVPGGETTFAIRIGEAHQGQGLSTPFLRLIVNATASLYDARDMWLETWASDGAAVHIYQKIGFKTVAEVADKRPVAAGPPADDARFYMSLDNDLLPPTKEAALSSNS